MMYQPCIFTSNTMSKMRIRMGMSISNISVDFYTNTPLNDKIINNIRNNHIFSKIIITGSVIKFYSAQNKNIIRIKVEQNFIRLFMLCLTQPLEYCKIDFVFKNMMFAYKQIQINQRTEIISTKCGEYVLS